MAKYTYEWLQQHCETWEGKPHGWVQWKGTDVCMDCYCKCGYHFHIDADFCYEVECPECHTEFAVNPHVQLVEIPEDMRTGSGWTETRINDRLSANHRRNEGVPDWAQEFLTDKAD